MEEKTSAMRCSVIVAYVRSEVKLLILSPPVLHCTPEVFSLSLSKFAPLAYGSERQKFELEI